MYYKFIIAIISVSMTIALAACAFTPEGSSSGGGGNSTPWVSSGSSSSTIPADPIRPTITAMYPADGEVVVFTNYMGLSVSAQANQSGTPLSKLIIQCTNYTYGANIWLTNSVSGTFATFTTNWGSIPPMISTGQVVFMAYDASNMQSPVLTNNYTTLFADEPLLFAMMQTTNSGGPMLPGATNDLGTILVGSNTYIMMLVGNAGGQPVRISNIRVSNTFMFGTNAHALNGMTMNTIVFTTNGMPVNMTNFLVTASPLIGGTYYGSITIDNNTINSAAFGGIALTSAARIWFKVTATNGPGDSTPPFITNLSPAAGFSWLWTNTMPMTLCALDNMDLRAVFIMVSNSVYGYTGYYSNAVSGVSAVFTTNYDTMPGNYTDYIIAWAVDQSNNTSVYVTNTVYSSLANEPLLFGAIIDSNNWFSLTNGVVYNITNTVGVPTNIVIMLGNGGKQNVTISGIQLSNTAQFMTNNHGLNGYSLATATNVPSGMPGNLTNIIVTASTAMPGVYTACLTFANNTSDAAAYGGQMLYNGSKVFIRMTAVNGPGDSVPPFLGAVTPTNGAGWTWTNMMPMSVNAYDNEGLQSVNISLSNRSSHQSRLYTLAASGTNSTFSTNYNNFPDSGTYDIVSYAIDQSNNYSAYITNAVTTVLANEPMLIALLMTNMSSNNGPMTLTNGITYNFTNAIGETNALVVLLGNMGLQNVNLSSILLSNTAQFMTNNHGLNGYALMTFSNISNGGMPANITNFILSSYCDMPGTYTACLQFNNNTSDAAAFGGWLTLSSYKYFIRQTFTNTAVDSFAPKITTFTPTNGASFMCTNNIPIVVSASDNSNVAWIYIHLSNLTYHTYTDYSNSFSSTNAVWSTTLEEVPFTGQELITVWAVDDANNESVRLTNTVNLTLWDYVALIAINPITKGPMPIGATNDYYLTTGDTNGIVVTLGNAGSYSVMLTNIRLDDNVHFTTNNYASGLVGIPTMVPTGGGPGNLTNFILMAHSLLPGDYVCGVSFDNNTPGPSAGLFSNSALRTGDKIYFAIHVTNGAGDAVPPVMGAVTPTNGTIWTFTNMLTYSVAACDNKGLKQIVVQESNFFNGQNQTYSTNVSGTNAVVSIPSRGFSPYDYQESIIAYAVDQNDNVSASVTNFISNTLADEPILLALSIFNGMFFFTNNSVLDATNTAGVFTQIVVLVGDMGKQPLIMTNILLSNTSQFMTNAGLDNLTLSTLVLDTNGNPSNITNFVIMAGSLMPGMYTAALQFNNSTTDAAAFGGMLMLSSCRAFIRLTVTNPAVDNVNPFITAASPTNGATWLYTNDPPYSVTASDNAGLNYLMIVDSNWVTGDVRSFSNNAVYGMTTGSYATNFIDRWPGNYTDTVISYAVDMNGNQSAPVTNVYSAQLANEPLLYMMWITNWSSGGPISITNGSILDLGSHTNGYVSNINILMINCGQQDVHITNILLNNPSNNFTTNAHGLAGYNLPTGVASTYDSMPVPMTNFIIIATATNSVTCEVTVTIPCNVTDATCYGGTVWRSPHSFKVRITGY